MPLVLPSFPTRRSSDLLERRPSRGAAAFNLAALHREVDRVTTVIAGDDQPRDGARSEEHTSELQSHSDLVCRLLLEKKNTMIHFTFLGAIDPATIKMPR